MHCQQEKTVVAHNDKSEERLLDIVEPHALSSKQTDRRRRVALLEKQVFAHLGVPFASHDIPINKDEYLHTIFVPTTNKQLLHPENYYVSHGFASSALMSFPLLPTLLEAGNVVLWEIRGMGLSIKLDSYQVEEADFEDFYLKSIEVMLAFYRHPNATLICHSFSCYIAWLYTLRKGPNYEHIKELVLLSPVGITPKEDDPNNQISSLSDCLRTVMHKCGWTFNLSFKSPLRTLCCCCKKYLVMSSFERLELTKEEKELMLEIVDTLVSLPDGSESIFFNYFEPKVLPKFPIEPIVKEEPLVRMTVIFGGAMDWADKAGAIRLQERYPRKVKVVVLYGCDHNIPFHFNECRALFEDLVRSASQ